MNSKTLKKKKGAGLNLSID